MFVKWRNLQKCPLCGSNISLYALNLDNDKIYMCDNVLSCEWPFTSDENNLLAIKNNPESETDLSYTFVATDKCVSHENINGVSTYTSNDTILEKSGNMTEKDITTNGDNTSSSSVDERVSITECNSFNREEDSPLIESKSYFERAKRDSVGDTQSTPRSHKHQPFTCHRHTWSSSDDDDQNWINFEDKSEFLRPANITRTPIYVPKLLSPLPMTPQRYSDYSDSDSDYASNTSKTIQGMPHSICSESKEKNVTVLSSASDKAENCLVKGSRFVKNVDELTMPTKDTFHSENSKDLPCLDVVSNCLSLALGTNVSAKIADISPHNDVCKDDLLSSVSELSRRHLNFFHSTDSFKEIGMMLNNSSSTVDLDFLSKIQQKLGVEKVETENSKTAIFHVGLNKPSINIPTDTLDVRVNDDIHLKLCSDSDGIDCNALKYNVDAAGVLSKQQSTHKRKRRHNLINKENADDGFSDFIKSPETVETFKYHLRMMMQGFVMPEQLKGQNVDPTLAMLITRKFDPSYSSIDINAMIHTYAKLLLHEQRDEIVTKSRPNKQPENFVKSEPKDYTDVNDSVLTTSILAAPASVETVPPHLYINKSGVVGTGPIVTTLHYEGCVIGPIHSQTEQEAKAVVDLIEYKIMNIKSRGQPLSNPTKFSSAGLRARYLVSRDILTYIDTVFLKKNLTASIIGKKKRNYPKRSQIIKIDPQSGEFIYPNNDKQIDRPKIKVKTEILRPDSASNVVSTSTISDEFRVSNKVFASKRGTNKHVKSNENLSNSYTMDNSQSSLLSNLENVYIRPQKEKYVHKHLRLRNKKLHRREKSFYRGYSTQNESSKYSVDVPITVPEVMQPKEQPTENASRPAEGASQPVKIIKKAKVSQQEKDWLADLFSIADQVEKSLEESDVNAASISLPEMSTITGIDPAITQISEPLNSEAFSLEDLL